MPFQACQWRPGAFSGAVYLVLLLFVQGVMADCEYSVGVVDTQLLISEPRAATISSKRSKIPGPVPARILCMVKARRLSRSNVP
jgi:hypothetical protein